MDHNSERRKQEISIIRMRKITLCQCDKPHILNETEKIKLNTNEMPFYKEQTVPFFFSIYFSAAQH